MWTLLIPFGLFVAFVALFLVFISVAAVIRTIIERRRIMRLPPLPPVPCPQCGSIELDLALYYMWDGVRDPETGERPTGDVSCFVCKQCGSRIAKRDNEPAYVPSDEEWDREMQIRNAK